MRPKVKQHCQGMKGSEGRTKAGIPAVSELNAVSNGTNGLAVKSTSMGLDLGAQGQDSIPAKDGRLVLGSLLRLQQLLFYAFQLQPRQTPNVGY